MKYIQYDLIDGDVLGIFDDTIFDTIPEPNIKINKAMWVKYTKGAIISVDIRDGGTPKLVVTEPVINTSCNSIYDEKVVSTLTLSAVRDIRDRLLTQSDNYLLADHPMRTQYKHTLGQIKEYRKQLRKFPKAFIKANGILAFPKL